MSTVNGDGGAAVPTIDDEESELDISEQTNRPKDVAVQQQRIQAWHPILDPEWVIVTLLLLSVILIPTGT